MLTVAGTTVALYLTTFVLVRVTGRRTVSELSAFDALITVALGSVLATSIVSDPPSYERGVAAIVTLLALQVLLASLRQHVPSLRRLLDFSPETVLDNGGLHLNRSPFGSQLTSGEIDAAVRAAGYEHRDEVAVVVLESNGSFSVIRNSQGP